MIETTNYPIKNIFKQHQVEQCEGKNGMETILSFKNNLIQDSERNEENRYPVPD
jgi:hypothetical protein